MKQKTFPGFEPALADETDFLPVALTTRPQRLIYCTLVAR